MRQMPFSSKVRNTPWPSYAFDWSSRSAHFATIAIASFLPSRENFIHVASLATEQDSSSNWQVIEDALPVEYVPTKLKWSPSLINGSEYLAASGDGIYLWRHNHHHPDSMSSNNHNIDGGGAFSLTGHLVARSTPRRAGENLHSANSTSSSSPSNPPAPITSFDWSTVDSTLLVSASYDTTCTIWCLESGSIKTQLIAHDREVFDVAFSPTASDTFVSVGADGSMRLFDVRSLDHSTIVYESPENRSLLRVNWNFTDPHYLSTFAINSSKAIIMDVRMPSVPASELKLPSSNSEIVDIKWSPENPAHILVADRYSNLYIWDLAGNDAGTIDNPISFRANNSDDSSIQQIVWPHRSPQWLGVASQNHVSIMHI